MPMPKRSQTVPDAMTPVYTAIIAQTDAFCQAHLDAECAVLCRELAASLARKRHHPLCAASLVSGRQASSARLPSSTSGMTVPKRRTPHSHRYANFSTLLPGP